MADPTPPPPPELNIPPSKATVDVSILNSSGLIRGVPTHRFLTPSIKGHDYLATPCYSFVITHRGPEGNRTLIFDLGIRKDFWNWPAPLYNRLVSAGYGLEAPRDTLAEVHVAAGGLASR